MSERTLSSVRSAIRVDEGTVSSQSALITAVIAIAALLVVGVSTGYTMFAVGGLIVGALFAVTIATVGTAGVLIPFIGGVSVLVVGAAAVGLPGYAVVSGASIGAWVAVAGSCVGFGLARFRVAAFGDGAVARAIGWLLRVGTVAGIYGLILFALLFDLSSLFEVTALGGLSELVVPTTDTGRILGFVVVSWLAVGGVWIVSVVLPPASVLPESKRSVYMAIVSRSVSTTGAILGVGSILVALVVIISVETGLATGTVNATLGLVMDSAALRTSFVRVFLTAVVLSGVIILARSIGMDTLFGHVWWSVSAIVCATGLFVVTIVSAPTVAGAVVGAEHERVALIEAIVSLIGAGTAGMALWVLVLFSVSMGLLVFPLLSETRLVPPATAGPRFVVFGLVIGVVSSVSAGVSSLVVLSVAVASVLVWDIGSFGVGVTADLGASPSHTGGEVVHAGASLVVGTLALAVTAIISWLLEDVTASADGTIVAVILAVGAAIVLSAVLRG